MSTHEPQMLNGEWATTDATRSNGQLITNISPPTTANDQWLLAPNPPMWTTGNNMPVIVTQPMTSTMPVYISNQHGTIPSGVTSWDSNTIVPHQTVLTQVVFDYVLKMARPGEGPSTALERMIVERETMIEVIQKLQDLVQEFAPGGLPLTELKEAA